MDFEVTLKNYRCFSDTNPASVRFQGGITALIGVNNSGKSSLLKFFYEFRGLFAMMTGPTGNLITSLLGNPQGFPYPNTIQDLEEVFCNSNKRSLEIQLDFMDVEKTKNHEEIPFPRRIVFTIPRATNTWSSILYVDEHPLDFSNGGIDYDGMILRAGGVPKVDLRILFEVSAAITTMLYVGPFRNTINVGTNENYFDISVGQAFIQRWRSVKTGHIKSENQAAYSLTKDIQRIFGFSDLEISSSDDNQTLQLMINQKSYKLSELGTGLAQFIIVLANAATKSSSFILIDEPELSLHPSLQLDFLTTLGAYSREGLMFATHSFGLARAGADRVYTFRQAPAGESNVTQLESLPRPSEFLGELGFSSYRELGFDKILLVEGPTEIKTIQQFLRLYGKDHKVVLLPLGGSSLINDAREAELLEVKRISENVHALIDSERTADGAPLEASRAGFKELCKRVGINCHVLERRAIENYLTDKALKRVKGEKYQALTSYQSRKEVPVIWAKEENWRIAREMTIDELETTDLGQYIKSI